MARRMHKVVAIAGGGDDIAAGGVDVGKLSARHRGCHARLLGAEHHIIDFLGKIIRRAHDVGAGAIGVEPA